MVALLEQLGFLQNATHNPDALSKTPPCCMGYLAKLHQGIKCLPSSIPNNLGLVAMAERKVLGLQSTMK
ncbi:MAG: hypothetical protein CMP47_12235 [Rickettsiales bacterium]|nr:hypothetical protein [Rickettsiales bacterium]